MCPGAVWSSLAQSLHTVGAIQNKGDEMKATKQTKRCARCGKTFKYTYRDIEMLVREYFSNLSEKYKERLDEIIEGHVNAQKVEVKPETLKRIEERYRAKK